MPSSPFRAIMIGDVVGRYGRKLLQTLLPMIKRKYQPGLVIANGENSAGGLGIQKRTADEMFGAGVDIITGGNHIWDKREALDLLKSDIRVLRPMNYHPDVPGSGFTVFRAKDHTDVLIINILGRVFMEPVVDNPFRIMHEFLLTRDERLVIIDFHAEATAEKQAMGFMLDGKVSAVLGTHTHVPTRDARIMPKGTGFQTDVGMTGSLESVIGMRKDPIVQKFMTGINQRFEVEKEVMILDMTVLDIDRHSGRVVAIEPVRVFEASYEQQLAE